MTFVAGDRVHVARLGTGIVREVRNGGQYLIELKGRAMVVAGSQLEAVEERRVTRRPTPTSPPDVVDTSAAPSRTLDLHGKTVAEAVDALDVFLNDALLDGCADVRVIHGRSGGKVKAAVHARLAQLASVRAFRLDPANAGVTVIRL
jgi:DNA mismatch repair protein MutS2